jgi:hypothetical protein
MKTYNATSYKIIAATSEACPELKGAGALSQFLKELVDARERVILVIRHGETDAGQGGPDTLEGIARAEYNITHGLDCDAQVKALASELKDLPVSQVVFSPLKRTYETAQMAFEGKGTHRADARLAEMAVQDPKRPQNLLLPEVNKEVMTKLVTEYGLSDTESTGIVEQWHQIYQDSAGGKEAPNWETPGSLGRIRYGVALVWAFERSSKGLITGVVVHAAQCYPSRLADMVERHGVAVVGPQGNPVTSGKKFSPHYAGALILTYDAKEHSVTIRGYWQPDIKDANSHDHEKKDPK